MDEMKSPIKEAKERLEPIWWFVRVFVTIVLAVVTGGSFVWKVFVLPRIR
jgi:hypothetical protein